MYKKENLLDFKILTTPTKSPSIRLDINDNRSSPQPPTTSSEVVFLKKKLVETHNRLLEQLDQAKLYQNEISALTEDLERYKDIMADAQGKV